MMSEIAIIEDSQEQKGKRIFENMKLYEGDPEFSKDLYKILMNDSLTVEDALIEIMDLVSNEV